MTMWSADRVVSSDGWCSPSAFEKMTGRWLKSVRINWETKGEVVEQRKRSGMTINGKKILVSSDNKEGKFLLKTREAMIQ